MSPPSAPYPEELAEAGVNFYFTMNESPPYTDVVSEGLNWFGFIDVDHAQYNDSANMVGWFILDEPDMNDTLGDENDRLAAVQALVADAEAEADGRFTALNIGNGINRTFWSPNTVDEIVQSVDLCCVDQYCYTAPIVNENVEFSGQWPGGSSNCAAAYGWLADQMQTMQDPENLKPFLVTVETAEPLILEEDARTITVPQIEGAMWAAIRHEASGIMLFQHNSDPALPHYSLEDETLRAGVSAITAKIHSLAPVLNTQTCIYDFDNGTDTMVKMPGDGFFYIVAGIGLGQATGSKTFNLPVGVTGNSAEVVGESRSISISSGSFSDTFAEEYTNHVYKIAI